MLEGLYSAGAGMEAAQSQLDAVSNNIANEDTPGYQAEVLGFHDLLYTTDDDDPSTAIVGAGSATDTLGFSQTQGSLQQTGNPLDLALNGPGYFQVRQPDGTTGLTRNGTFELNARGQITTNLGMELVPPITVPKGTQPSQISIAPGRHGHRLRPEDRSDQRRSGDRAGQASAAGQQRLRNHRSQRPGPDGQGRDRPAGLSRAVQRRPRH